MHRLIPVLLMLILVSCTTPTLTQAPASPTSPELALATPTEVEPTIPSATNTPPPYVYKLPDPSTTLWSLVVSGLVDPLDLQNAGDERLFVVSRQGRIWVLEGGELLPEPFLDITRWVNSEGQERGLLGLAFHPDYTENGQFFVNYIDTQGNTVIARFEVSAERNVADRNSLRIILRFEQPYPNHNGGGIAFGQDAHLYIGTGDGGSANDPLGNGQSLETLLGKILRIDIDSAEPYAIPPDNPYVGGGGLAEIWAYGLRNPWRFAFDQLTNDLYIADVGQNSWEEINFQPAGAAGGINYGWNIREGAHAFAGDTTEGLTDPVAEYGHELGISVTGGVVVRDPSLPDWKGVYLYGDYGTGLIWGMVRDEQGNWQSDVLFDTEFRISSFGQGAEGRLYLTDFRTGGVFRLERIP